MIYLEFVNFVRTILLLFMPFVVVPIIVFQDKKRSDFLYLNC